MKSKSSHHHDENRFKFLKFSERIAKINIDVIRKGGRTENVPRDADSFFGEGLAKWAELNCTQDFVAFHREVSGCTQTFALLVHHEQKVVDALKSYLKNSISLAYPPLLDLIVQLARDLQTDFYPHFREFFDIIVSLLNTQDTEIIECAFQTLVYLFKFLWRYLLRDIKEVFGFYSPLLSGHQKEHIRNFAAESFGFLMRKIHDPNDLFDFMLASLEERPDQVEGVGRLFFEMTKGVCKQFHSCTEKVLPILLDKLGPFQSSVENSGVPAELPWQLVLETLSEMLTSMAKYTSKEHAQVVWQALQDCVLKLHQAIANGGHKPKAIAAYSEQLGRLVQLVRQWVQWNNGGLLTESTQLAKVILKLYSCELPAECGREVLNLTVSLLTVTKVELPQDIIDKLVNAMYSSKYDVSALLDVSRKTFKMADFEKDLLPSLMQYCHNNMATKSSSTKEAILFTLTDLILGRQDPITDSMSLQDYKPYSLDFRLAVHKGKKQSTKKKAQNFPEYVLSRLDFPEDLLAEDNVIPSLWAAITCLPSLKPLDVDLCSKKLQKLINDVWSIVSAGSDLESDTLLYLLSQAIICLLLINSSSTETLIETDFIIQLLQAHPASPHALLAADIFFAQDTGEDLSVDIMEQIFPTLQLNLSSPYHKVRHLTLLILNQFPVELPVVPDLPTQQVSIFQLCLQAEQIPISVEDYREKLKCLQKLDYSAVRHNIPNGPYQEVPLRYLLGMLYVNFKWVWQPTTELIKSHAYGMDRKVFWEIFSQHLQTVASKTEKEFIQSGENKSQQTKPSLATQEPASSLAELFGRVQDDMIASLDRPDDWNYRVLLWKAMGSFADKAEAKTRELSPLLFRFMKNEYYPADVNDAPTQDITRKKRKTDQSESKTDIDQSDEAMDDDATQVEEPGKADRKRRIGIVNKCLVAILDLFAKFSNPNALYMEPQLKELYFKLLSSKNGLIQKAAVACIMTYKYKYLIPYKDNFDGLMDDKLFREALVQFSIEEDNGIVLEEHREGLLPVLFRILYGKMLSKTGTGTQGKGGGSTRRSIVLRFIASCQSEAEMDVFMDLVLAPCRHLIKGDSEVMMQDALNQLDLSAVIPLKKQHSMLDTLGVIFNKLGHVLERYKSTFLHLITSLVASYNKMLDQRQEIQPFSVNQLKNLRQVGSQLLVSFFEHFDKYPFSANEIDCIFEAAVWPHVEKLANESLASPTTLLKLFAAWSRNPRYHCLLAKHHPDNNEVTALPNVIALLASPTVSAGVVTMVMDLVECLLMEPDYEPEGEVQALPVKDMKIMNESQFTVPPSFGTKLLFRHVAAILEFLSSSVKVKGQAIQKGKGELPMRELNILSKVSTYIQDPEQCSVLITLLLPYLQKTTEKHQTIELDILRTICNVIKLIEEPSSFLVPISKLFYRLTLRPSRAAICDIFAAMAKTDTALRDVSNTVMLLNAWDRKRFEEPDFKKRLEAFKLANQRLAAMETIDVQYLTPMIYNSFYFIMKVEEMSLRDNATNFLTAVITKLANGAYPMEIFNVLIIQKYIPAIRQGFRLKSENARHELIGLLASLVRRFPDHPRFTGLQQLRDEQDVEIDFFENIRHIQHHRRMRALRRLAQHCKDNKIPSVTLNYFLLPMTTAIVFDQSKKDNNLILEAVTTVGAIATRLSWRQYISILKQYLILLTKKLEMQKTAVRLVVAVLDAFHFDLSLSEEMPESQLANPNKSIPKEQTVDKTTNKSLEKTEKEKEDSDGEEDSDEDDDEEDEEVEEVISPEEKQRQMDVALATRIHRIIVLSILPQLHKTITKKVESDDRHKKARGNMASDEEVLRVPIALAMVKLLQALPKKTLHQNLPGILIKVCQMQKSRSKDLRDISRDTLVKILQSLGVSYFGYILKELRHALTRGYMLHVLSFTVHTLLKSMETKLECGDLDKCLGSLLKVFNDDIFGEVAEEKDVQGIVVKLPEARTNKSYDCYEMVAKVIGQGSLTQFILPLKEVLDTSHSHKKVTKVQEVMRHMTLGLLGNDGITMEIMLIFIHGLVYESLPLMTSVKKAEKALEAISAPDPRLQTSSVYILPKTPKRGGFVPTTSSKTNAHIVVEFGLQLLNMHLKRSKLISSNKQHLSMLDPFVDFVVKCTNSKHVKVTSASLRCLTWLLRYPLPAVEKNAKDLTKMLFVLLKNYASAGAVKSGSASFDLVVNCFKALTVMVRDVKQHSIDEEQLKVLLTYAEEDIHDINRQSTAFGLLKAILSRKLIIPEIHEVMKKVRQLSVTSQIPAVRLQCRQVIYKFLLDYPLGKKLKAHLEFYVNQIAYPMETGRESALEMLATIFSSFPQKVLCNYAGLFYVPMGARLMNEETTKCRKLTALAIKSLLQKIDIAKRDELFEITLSWLDGEEKITHQCLGAQLCGLFVEAEEVETQRRLDSLLPVLCERIKPQHYEQDAPDDEDESENADREKEERHSDHLLFHLLSTLAKILQHCAMVRSKEYVPVLNAIWESVKRHLLHPHSWVRLTSAQLFGALFAAWKPEELANLKNTGSEVATPSQKQKKSKKRKSKDMGMTDEGGEEEKGYLEEQTHQRISDLSHKFCSQLQSPHCSKDLGDQVVRNLVFIAKVLIQMPVDTTETLDFRTNDTTNNGDAADKTDDITDDVTDKSDDVSNRTDDITRSKGKPISCMWLIKRMCIIASREAAKSSGPTLKRTCVVKWLAAVAVDLGKDRIEPYLLTMLRPISREANDKMTQSDNELRVLCEEVLELIKGMVGLEMFSHVYTSLQRRAAEQKYSRKRKAAMEAVIDPDKAAQRKIKKQQSKKESKKRKIQAMRPEYQINKKKMKHKR